MAMALASCSGRYELEIIVGIDGMELEFLSAREFGSKRVLPSRMMDRWLPWQFQLRSRTYWFEPTRLFDAVLISQLLFLVITDERYHFIRKKAQ